MCKRAFWKCWSAISSICLIAFFTAIGSCTGCYLRWFYRCFSCPTLPLIDQQTLFFFADISFTCITDEQDRWRVGRVSGFKSNVFIRLAALYCALTHNNNILILGKIFLNACCTYGWMGITHHTVYYMVTYFGLHAKLHTSTRGHGLAAILTYIFYRLQNTVFTPTFFNIVM